MLKDAQSPDVEQFDVEAVNKKENRSLYEARTKIHPKRVHGSFRTLKWWIMGITLAVYYGTPWLRWHRGEHLPDQAVLIDFPGRRFYFFFIEIWPQELFFVTGLLVMAGIGLFLTTSVAGRMWCGYSCPQTVWTDLFVAVERFVEGDRNARLRLDKAPLSMSKLGKRAAKHAIWLVIGFLTGGAWILYYADAPTLIVEFFTLNASPVAYITVAALTGLTYLLGGFAREQVCTYMCPWPRIMGAMMDEDSMVVTYLRNRGEPRGAHKASDSWDGRGDCIDCNACVAACPMGIDIRDGQQLECITCALCIDACDDVMRKVDRPVRLIDYATVAGQSGQAETGLTSIRPIRPRTITYFALWSLVGVIMLYALLTRADMDINILRDRNPLFVPLANGDIRNGYTLKVLNKAHLQRKFGLTIEGVEGAQLRAIGAQDGNGNPTFTVLPDQIKSFRVLVTIPRAALQGTSTDIRFVISDPNSDNTAVYDAAFRGPEK